MIGNRKSNIVGVYLTGYAIQTIILWGIPDRIGNGNSNIVEVYLIS